MKIKFNRGPMKNKRIEAKDGSYEYIVQEPKMVSPFYYTQDIFPAAVEFMYKRGSYMKSNVRLKDGTYVFEWMGWKE